MKAIIVFPLKAKKTRRIAEAIASGLQKKGFETESALLEIIKKKKEKTKIKSRNKEEKKKLEEIELAPTKMDLAGFDLVVFGSPVFGLSPKRKISKAVETYIRQCQNLEKKKAAVFLTCFGVPGTALKKITGILQTQDAEIVDSTIVAYLLGLSEKQLEQAKEFGEKLAGMV